MKPLLRTSTALATLLIFFVSSLQVSFAAYNPSGWVNYGGSTNADVTAAVATPTTLAIGAVTSTTVSLTWVDASSNESSYRIERAPDSSGTPGTFAEVGNTAANATTYTDTSLTASTMYWYRIRAYSGSSYSAYTANVSTTTAVATLLPSATNIGYTSTPVTPTSTTLANFTTTPFTGGNNTSVGTADASTLATTASGTTGSGTASVPFTTSGNYTLQNAAAQVSGGVASLTGSAGSSPVNYSARFRGTSTTSKLERTPTIAGDRANWTVAFWVKRGHLTDSPINSIFSAGTGSQWFEIKFDTSDRLDVAEYGNGQKTTSAVFRDPSAWYHIVVSSSSNVRTIYVNGSQVTSFANNTAASSNSSVNSAQTHRWGTRAGSPGSTEYFDGYLADTYLIDGQALTPSSFAQSDANGQWVPKTYSGTYGTNGSHLTFANSSAMGTDVSGQGNTWTANNIATTDQMLDTPTNNFATLNPLDIPFSTNIAFTNGNLTGRATALGSTYNIATSGMQFGGMKVYAEVKYNSMDHQGVSSNVWLWDAASSTGVRYQTGGTISYYNGSTYTNYAGSANTTGDVAGFAIDAINGSVGVYHNGSLQATVPAPSFTSSSRIMIQVGLYGSSAYPQATLNLGQSAYAYAAPSGYGSLSTANLPTPAITKPNQYFDAVTYTGNGTSQSISSLQFQPDLIWAKSRSNTQNNVMTDSVRGIGKLIYSDSTSAENTDPQSFTGVSANGFSIGTSVIPNQNAYTYVAWNWKRSPTSGFDVVTYTGNGSGSGQFVPYNIGGSPGMILVKSRDQLRNWWVWHKNLSVTTNNLRLNTTDALVNDLAIAGGPISSGVPIAGSGTANVNNEKYIVYAWSEVPGFSKFGSYTGNASADGPFIYTGFKPRWILVKPITSSYQWSLFDTARNPSNPMNGWLQAQSSGAESTAYNVIDSLSNGFKLRISDLSWNDSGGTYIYAAFADQALQPTNLTTYTANATTLVTTSTDQLSTTTWSGITSVAVTETKPTNTSIYYATSFDGRTTFAVNTTGAWRQIARSNAGTWQYNSNTTYGSTTWAACTTNTQNDCLSQAFGVTANQMTGTQLAAITTGNWTASGGWTPGNTIDIATGLSTTDATATPSVDNIQFIYSTAPRYAANLFTYNTSAYAVTSLAPQLLAFATANAGNGITTALWNANSSSWYSLTSLNNSTGSLPASISYQTVSSSIANYIDGSGFVRVLTYSTNPSTGGTSAVLTTDYAGLPLWGTMINASPNIPTLISPSNAGYVASNQPTLSATYSDPDANDNGTTEYRIATGSAGNCTSNTSIVASGSSSTTSATAANITSTTTWTPGSSIGSDGVYYWCARNNDSVAVSAWTSMGSFTLDTAAPATPTVSYTNAYLNSTSQSVTFSSTDAGSGIASYTLYRNAGTLSAGSCSSYSAFASLGTQSSPYTDSALASANCYQYYVTATDNATNATSSTNTPTDVTKVDIVAPAIGTAPAVTDTDSASATWTNALTVAIGAFGSSDTLSAIWKYLINESSTTPLGNDASWVTSAPVTYTIGNATNAAKTIYFWVMDLAGNISTYVSTGITLDTVAPSSTTISINSAASYATSSTLTLTLSAADPGGSGLATMQFSCNNSTYTTAEAYATSKSFVLGSNAAVGCTTSDGAKTVYVQYLDLAGNTSTQVNSSITLDTTAPALSVTDNANGSWNTSDTIVATQTETNPSTLQWDYDADGTCPTLTGSYANTYTSGNTLTVNTTHTDYVCFLAIDAAGNTTTAVTNVLKVDITTPTTSGSVTIDGTWISRVSVVDNNWSAITYGNGLFVAVGSSGTGNRVMTSPDGITWIARTSAVDNNWVGVTHGNGLFVAVAVTGTGDRVMTSPDGITWTARASAADNNWRSVTYGNGLFVAVAGTGTGNRVMTSPDGITWTARASAVDNIWMGVTYGNGLFVAVGQIGTGNRVMTSPDGITWTARTSAFDYNWRAVTYGNGLFVAVAAATGTGDSVMTSPDGITWTARTSAADNAWLSVTYGNGLFVAVAQNSTGNRVMTSPDGITWTIRTSAVDNLWMGVTYGNGLFTAVSATGTSNRVMTLAPSILGSNSWYTTNVTYTLTNADATSGVASTVYCTDTTNACVPGTAGTSVTVSTNSATNYVRWSSTDTAGNVQTTQSSGAIKVDKDTPTTSASATAGTLSLNGWYTTNATVTLTEADVGSGVASTAYCVDQVNSCTPSTIGTSVSVTTEGTNYVRYRSTDTAGNVQTTASFTVKLDKTVPVVSVSTVTSPNGSETWGGGTSHALTWNPAGVSDATSGIASVTLAYSTDGSSYTSIATGEANDGTYAWTTPDITSSTVTVRVTAVDVAGLSAADVSDANFTLTSTSTFTTLAITTGSKQTGGTSAALPTELKVRVGNGFGAYATAGDETVAFTIASVPTLPTATGQALSNGSFGTTFGGTSTVKTVTTDANGYASTIFALGSRAGDYVVTASFGDGSGSRTQTFTLTEREEFNLTVSKSSYDLSLDPEVAAAGRDTATVTVTTNAASYTIAATPVSYPTRVGGSETLPNWVGSGFGWHKDSGATAAFGTPVDSCAASCTGTRTFTISLDALADFAIPGGTYLNSVTFAPTSIGW